MIVATRGWSNCHSSLNGCFYPKHLFYRRKTYLFHVVEIHFKLISALLNVNLSLKLSNNCKRPFHCCCFFRFHRTYILYHKPSLAFCSVQPTCFTNGLCRQDGLSSTGGMETFNRCAATSTQLNQCLLLPHRLHLINNRTRISLIDLLEFL